MTFNETKRNNLVREAILILLAAQLEQSSRSDLPFDDAVIADFERQLKSAIEKLPPKYGELLLKVSNQVEADPEVIVANGSFLHFLAVEIACLSVNLPETPED